jgi:hypothetical protein
MVGPVTRLDEKGFAPSVETYRKCNYKNIILLKCSKNNLTKFNYFLIGKSEFKAEDLSYPNINWQSNLGWVAATLRQRALLSFTSSRFSINFQ